MTKNKSLPKKPTAQIVVAVAILFFALISVLLILLALNKPVLEKKITALRENFHSFSLLGKIDYDTEEYGYTVFISVSDMAEKATVFRATASSPLDAFDEAAKKAETFIGANDYDPAWVKADIVNTVTTMDHAELSGVLVPLRIKGFRQGIAFDKNFDLAFLEAELNGSDLISYSEDILSPENIKSYLEGRNDQQSFSTDSVDTLYLFTTLGYLIDEENQAYSLHDRGHHNGRRMLEYIDSDYVMEQVALAADFLNKLIKDDGSFVYGIYPVADRVAGSYNILRHAGATWSLVNYYSLARDESFIAPIEKALDYLETAIEYPQPGLAYVIERKADEAKLGGNAIAILAFSTYNETFGTDKYVDVIASLAEGILSFQDTESGAYFHTMYYPEYTKKDEYRTVYYDGEGTYALARAYEATSDDRYLEAAKLAIRYFIDNEYEQYRDHWISYSLNEVTKHYPDPEFLSFGLKNAQTNLAQINKLRTTDFVQLELLMATYELYERVMRDQPELPYLSEFDDELLLEAISNRVDRTFDAFSYPEFAMYWQRPSSVQNAFFVRNDSFRIRIDDIQHAIVGLQNFSVNYDQFVKRSEEVR